MTRATPLLSAGLIVRDEEEVIADCLASLAGLVDEIVVYDTGSVDRTRDIARRMGARVVEGFWDDHFGDARNRALEHCRGRWVLAVDADEVVRADPAAVRAALAGTDVPSYGITIENTSSGGVGSVLTMVAVRLFRRQAARYAGRLHEQVVSRRTGELMPVVPFNLLTIVHGGYHADRMESRGKVERNLRLAELAVAAADSDGVVGADHALVQLARTQITAGRAVEAAATLRRVAATVTDRVALLVAGKVAVRACLEADDTAEAQAWLERLVDLGEMPERIALSRAELLAHRGELQAALDVLDALPELATGPDGMQVRRTDAAWARAKLLLALGRSGPAADCVLEAVAAGISDRHVRDVMTVVHAAERGAGAIAAVLPDALWRPYLAQTLQCPPDFGDELLEAMWQRRPGDLGVLVAASQVATTLPVLRALEWSARLRAHGRAADCPLVAIVAAEQREPRDRVVAGAVALEAFSDARAYPPFERALEGVPDEQAAAVLDELRLLAPGIASALLVTPPAG